MAKLKKHGKGIVLMHDFQQRHRQAAAELLDELKAGGYKIVHHEGRRARSRPSRRMTSRW